MKILYGVQATGNGHITRARVMAPALKAKGFEVDYIFSGRAPDKFFEMDAFGDYKVYGGLTFSVENGCINYYKSFFQAKLFRLAFDILGLDLSSYDLIITDFEPITAWAAKYRGIPSIGLGHQYAFSHDVPRQNDSWVSQLILKWFAPAEIGLGSHWHHFNRPIMPPLVDIPTIQQVDANAPTLVYLPFDNAESVMAMLQAIPAHEFMFHSTHFPAGRYGNVEVFPFSRQEFAQNLQRCSGVICGAGFELASEALHLGKRLMVKPTLGQMEQESNAKALSELGLGAVMNSFNPEQVVAWLRSSTAIQIEYPDVAGELADWISQGDYSNHEVLVKSLWSKVKPGSGERAFWQYGA